MHQHAGQVTVEPVAVDAHLQPVTDQARRRTVEDAAHRERAAAGHRRFFLDEVGGTVLRQILKQTTVTRLITATSLAS